MTFLRAEMKIEFKLSIKLSQVEKKCTGTKLTLGLRSGLIKFVNELILLISAQIKSENFKLVIMSKVRAKAQKCESLLIY